MYNWKIVNPIHMYIIISFTSFPFLCLSTTCDDPLPYFLFPCTGKVLSELVGNTRFLRMECIDPVESQSVPLTRQRPDRFDSFYLHWREDECIKNITFKFHFGKRRRKFCSILLQKACVINANSYDLVLLSQNEMKKWFVLVLFHFIAGLVCICYST